MSSLNIVSIACYTILTLCFVAWITPQRYYIPEHLRGHPLVDKPGFLDEATVDDLLQWTREMGSIPSVARDTDSYKVKRTHIGEALPFDNITQKCPKPFLIPDETRQWCVFPGRIDVGKHYILAGGIEGLKEPYDVLVSRVQPFIKYFFNYSEHKVAKRLLESKEFVKLAKAVCPANKQGVLDYFQFNLVVQVPGQTVATHLDAPVFYHANRFEFPQWLLVTMVFSGLFQDDFVDQVQVVTYYHKWNKTVGGEFYFWDDNSGIPKISYPVSRNANSVDGSKTIHAARVYQPSRRPPVLDDAAINELRYNKATTKWDVVSNGNVKATYNESEIRFGAVYRARCFADEADLARFKHAQQSQFSLDHVLNVFREDLKKKGLYRDNMDMYDFSLLLMKTYVSYPYASDALVPYNYCVLDKLYPFLKPVLQLFC